MKLFSTRLLSALLLLVPGVASSQATLEELEELAIKRAAEIVAPSVVTIDTVGGLEKSEGVLIGTGPTTGVIVSADGHIMSSSFSFIQKPTSILVTLPSSTLTAT